MLVVACCLIRKIEGADRAGPVFLNLHKGGLAEEVAAEEHAVADLVVVEVTGEGGFREGRIGLDQQHEAEPARAAAQARE